MENKQTQNFKIKFYNLNRNKIVDIAYNAVGMTIGILCLGLYFIASSTGTMGETVALGAGTRFQTDFYLYSVWGASIATVYFAYKLIMTLINKESVIDKYLDQSLIAVILFVFIFFTETQISMAGRNPYPFGRSATLQFRSVWEHFLLLVYLIVYFVLYPPTVLDKTKDKMIAAAISTSVMFLYFFIITIREVPGAKGENALGYPYPGFTPGVKVSWGLYLPAIIGMIILMFGLTLLITWLNQVIYKKHGMQTNQELKNA